MNRLKGVSLFANVGIAETYLKNVGIDIVVANELLDMFKKNFSEDWLQEVVWAEYSIKFEYFNPMNGESSTVKYMIERKLKNNQKNS